MYLEDLINTYKEIAEKKILLINTEAFIQTLTNEIVNKKYDLQDQTFIETALRDDKESFIETFIKLLERKLNVVENLHDYLDSNEFREDVINFYVKSIEYTVDFFYNTIISKQFSDT
ncbi:MAG: hypothetical protein ACRENO_01055 [Thermodesulfobacteriota bacterium]